MTSAASITYLYDGATPARTPHTRELSRCSSVKREGTSTDFSVSRTIASGSCDASTNRAERMSVLMR